MRTSAGLLLYRHTDQHILQVFLVHPGGPFWARKDEGSWSIPKGEVDADEDPRAAALRELTEETGFRLPPDAELLPLAPVRLRSGKQVVAWAVAHDVNPAELVSNTTDIAWPPRSGKTLTIPEVDRGEWFDLTMAEEKINAGQQPLLAELSRLLESRTSNFAGTTEA